MYRRRAGVHEHEAPRAIRVLHHSGLDAALAEERGLLVACDTGNGDAAGKHRTRSLSQHAARALHHRQHRARHGEERQQLVVPCAPFYVIEQRARSIRHIGDVRRAA